ncbi:LysM peptidoglycan-binding domain-containing M23 family metallopeptidase [Chlorogloea sp. CCALA 695]|uniref:LysM peptidoglycan-binding domain-containing M23 family metallopeptidase n=1 Tax=Chlorogloea sp. CCALA 695 TaxID=2107693 RepID=UPI0011B29E37|nr:LysM peptidoglycan-binding domain-containing M23 family metallopeptidase [Chlorogloea sp. CCALA 695]
MSKNALEKQLQPKVRVFRTSAAIIGLTVSVGTPNLLLTQAAQLPQVSSSSTQGEVSAPEIVQVVPLVSALPIERPQVVPSTPYSTAKKAIAPIYNHPAPVVESSAPKTKFTVLQPSEELVSQPPVANRSLALRLRQHQQESTLERTQALSSITASNAQQNFAPIKATREAEVVQNRAIEIVPNQIVVASSPSEVRSPLNVEANSGWTAKQRLLIDGLKSKENSRPLNNPVVQVPNNTDLAPPVTTLSQPAVVAAPNLEGTLPKNIGSQALVAATSDQSREFAAPLQAEVIVLPQTQSNHDLATTPTEVAAAAPGDRTATEQLAISRSPGFVPPASVAPSANTTSTEVKAVDEQQIATQALPEAVENSSPVKEIVTSVNEPIIVSATTSEYQVKPGDTLITIASAHRLSLPEVAKFNHLSDPDLLLVDQKIKIPSLTSMTPQANVAVLPPIEKVEPTAQTNSLPVVALPSVAKVPLVATAQEVVLTNPPAPAYTGVGGNTPGEVEAKPLEPTALNDLQVQYAQKLQNDVQKLKQKYHAQNSSNPIVLVRAVKGESQQVVRPSAKLDNEPINPDFQVAQTYQDLKPVTQKQLINRVNYSAPASVRGRVATAPVSGDNSNESFPARQVIPELPPLDPAMNYLPQPNGGAPLNGYIWPARGALTSNYGWRWGRMHRGIDIAAPVGTPIFAAAPGVVIKSGWNKGGYGNLVDIQHADGTLTRYAHNYRLLVQPGQFVDQGQQISLMGSTGRSTGPHLHFEIRPSGKGAVNPIALLPKSR